MPKIRPPRSQEPELEPVLATIEPLPTEAITFDVEDDSPPEPTVIDLAPEPTPEPEPTPAPAPSNEDALRRALDATRRAEDLQRQLTEARQQNVQRDQDLQEAQYTSILTHIGAEQASLDKAEGDYASFAAAGDWANAAKAQRAIATASSRIDRLEDNKAAFDTRREEIKRTPRQEAQPSLPSRAQDWLNSHPEFKTDVGKNNQLGSVHKYIIDRRGIEPFSDAYFEALDTEFGFKRETQAEPTSAPAPQRRSLPVSAPVSREVPTASGSRATNQIHLSAEERAIARSSFGPIKGPDGKLVDLTNDQKERLYANNKAKLHAKRASGEYRHTTEQTG